MKLSMTLQDQKFDLEHDVLDDAVQDLARLWVNGLSAPNAAVVLEEQIDILSGSMTTLKEAIDGSN